MKKRYIKDYVSDEKGELQYRGKYYFSRLTEEEKRKEGVAQIVFSVLCLVLILIALCIPCNGNRTIYVVIPVEITLLSLWVQLSGSIRLLSVGNRMEQKDYDKAFQSPIQALTIALILYVFSFGGQLIGIFIENSKRSNGDIYFGMLLFFVFVISGVAWNRRRKLMNFVSEEKME